MDGCGSGSVIGAIVIEGHVQGLSNVRSLGELGIPVYVVDRMHCLAMHSRFCRKFFRVDDFTSEEFIDFLVSLSEKEKLDGWILIPSNDHIVENLSRHKETIGKHYRMLVPSESELYRIINKLRLLELARGCGVPIPNTCPADCCALASEFEYPLLVRGAMGLTFYKAFHRKAVCVESNEELVANLQAFSKSVSLSEIMIQERIPDSKGNEVVSFTCFAVDGEVKTYWMGRKLREHPIKYGTATYAISVHVPEVVEPARKLVAALGYTGVCEIEFMLDIRDGLYKLIEINPRTWLWVGLARECGVDYARMIYGFLNGEQQRFPSGYDVGVKWINYLTDFVFAVKRMKDGSLSLKDYIRSLKGRKVHAVWSWSDPMPGLLFPFMSFYIAGKRS